MKDGAKFIRFAIAQGALQFGEFTLKSGRSSPYFFNAGTFNDGHALEVLSRFYAQAIIDARIKFDMLFGPAYKGIPLVAAVAMALSREYKRGVPYAFNRKEVKQYGEGGRFVGAPIKGRVLLIDDVITAGTAINEVIDMIQGAGGQPVGAAVAFDRSERAADMNISAVRGVEQRFGIMVITVANSGELVEYMESQQLYVEHLPGLKKYLATYEAERP